MKCFFHESQKGIDNPTDVLKSGKRRKGRRRSEPSKYGTMGNEFGTVLCAVDEVGHAIAKHVCMGHIELDDIYLNIHPYLKNVTFKFCSKNLLEKKEKAKELNI